MENEPSKNGCDKLTQSKTFCVLPWIHRFTNIRGEIQVCCTSEEFDNNVRHDRSIRALNPKKNKMRIQEVQDDKTIMNSRFMQILRKQMMDGEWPEICLRCQQTEDGGGQSRRNVENERFEDLFEDIEKNTEPSGRLKEVKVRYYDYRLGNLCNLACRMCSPMASTKWINEYYKFDHDQEIKDPQQLEPLKKLNWYKDPKTWQAFLDQMGHVRHLHLAGGEPLLIKYHEDVLKKCIDAGVSQKISIGYNTNMTVIPEKLKEYWPHFKHISISASIDGFDQVNDYIRYPAKWKDIAANLIHLDQNFDQYNLRDVELAVTVQAYNVLSLNQLIDFLMDNFKRVAIVPRFYNLYGPNHFRTQVLPTSLKELAQYRLEQSAQKLRKRVQEDPFLHYLEERIDHFSEVIQFMHQEDRFDLFPKLIQISKNFDQYRNQNLFQVVPEFSSYSHLTDQNISAEVREASPS